MSFLCEVDSWLKIVINNTFYLGWYMEANWTFIETGWAEILFGIGWPCSKVKVIVEDEIGTCGIDPPGM